MQNQSLNEEAVFQIARRIQQPEALAAYLEQACDGDQSLHARVLALLGSPGDADQFLEAPPSIYHFEAVATMDQTLIEKPGTQIGPYKLLQQIGEGGMGAVYMAEQKEPLRRTVALKIIKPGMDSQQVVARFEAERQALAMMNHPNIAKVLDAGATESGRPYFVMELVKGIPITEYCDTHKLTTRQRLELLVTICEAVQHAHQKGIIHRDLKPGNLLIELHDVRPVPKVVDFGIAKSTNQRLTERTLCTNFSQMIGTPLYMSPEQAQLSGLDVDTRSDVYSLGVLLYELITGTTPFTKESMSKIGYDEMRRKIQYDDPPRPSERISTLNAEALTTLTINQRVDTRKLQQQVRNELDWVVMKALDKDRTRRYQTATAFAEDIQRYLNDEPVQACPPSTLYRFKKIASRNRAALATVTLVSLALIAGTVVSVMQAIRATQAQKVANSFRDSSEKAREVAETARRSEAEQRALAVTSEQQAKQSASESQAVLKFFEEKVLAAARPKGKEGGLGVETSIRDALVAAESQIGLAFQDLPLVEASIRTTLGNTFGYIGDHSLYLKQIERSMHLRLDALGPDHADTLNSMSWLAWSYFINDRLEDALLLIEQTAEKQTLTLGQEHPDTLGSLSKLAVFYEHSGQLDKACSLNEMIVEKNKATSGPDSGSTIASISNLASVYENSGRTDESIVLFEHVYERSKHLFGPYETGTLTHMHRLAYAYYFTGQNDLAQPLYELAYEQRKTVLGWEHPQTLASLSGLSQACSDPDLFKKALVGTLDERHRESLISMRNLANSYDRSRYPDRDEPIWRELAELWKVKAGSDSPQYSDQLMRIGVSLIAQKKHVDAELVLRECLQIRETAEPNAWPTYRTKYLLGESLVGQNNYIESEGLLLDGYEGMHEHEATLRQSDMVFRIRALRSLAKLYKHIGQVDKSAEWKKKLGEAGGSEDEDVEWKRKLDANEWNNKGVNSSRLGKSEDAIRFFTNAIELEASPQHYKLRGKEYENLSNIEMAAADLKTAARLAPKNQEIWNTLGRLQVQLGLSLDAIDTLSVATAINTETDAESRAILATAYILDGQPETSIQVLETLFKEKPSNPGNLYLSLAYLSFGNFESYRSECEVLLARINAKSAELEKDTAVWICSLSPNALSDYAPAILLARNLVQARPREQQFILHLGSILLRAGQYEDAKIEFEKGTSLPFKRGDSSAPFLYLFALLKEHRGEHDQAVEQFEKAEKQAQLELSQLPRWNRKLAIQILGKEVKEIVIGAR